MFVFPILGLALSRSRRLSLSLSLGSLEPLLVVIVEHVSFRASLRSPRLVTLDVRGVHLSLKLLNLNPRRVATLRRL